MSFGPKTSGEGLGTRRCSYIIRIVKQSLRTTVDLRLEVASLKCC